LRVDQPHGGAEKRRDLRVVSAGMRRPRRSVSLRMPGHHQRVELPEHGERRPVARLPAQVRADARDGKAALRRETELPERLFDELRGLEFLEAQLRVTTDLLAESNDLVRARVDRRKYLPFEIGFS